jgi:hypothetical protein
MSLPKHFCWSRFGTEAGEVIPQIIERKERERSANGGIFLWGIGSAIGPAMTRLVQLEPEPEVIFSPIRSAPKKIDVIPGRIARWTAARQIDGTPYQLPKGSIVTSRAKDCRHYALVCLSQSALELGRQLGEIVIGRIRNLTTNNPVGFSQVTAIVRQETNGRPYSDLTYSVAMRFRLVDPYVVELRDPVITKSTY